MATEEPGKWYTNPRSLNQKLALDEAISGGDLGKLKATHGTGAPKSLGDPRLSGMDVTKYEYTRSFTDPKTGKVIDKVSIHYLKDNATGITFDFKFKEIGF